MWIGIYAYHLWFLAFLWLYSLLALPLFVFLRRAAGQRVLDKLAAWCSRPGGIFLFALPIAVIQMALRAVFPAYSDWADFVYWFAFFVYGYLLFSRPSFTEAMRRQGWFALDIGILCDLVIFALSFGRFWPWDIPPGYTPIFLLFQLLLSINTWASLVFILSCGIRWLNRSSNVLHYANEAALPFPRPVGYYVYRWIFVRTPEQLARLNASWQVPYARFVRRLVTLVWGLAFVGEALLDTFLLYHLPTAQWVAIHPLLFWGTIVAAFGWATLYARYVQPKIQASLRQIAQEQAARTGENRQEAPKHPVG